MASEGLTKVYRDRRLSLLLFALLFGFFALFSHGYIDNPDAEVEYQTARAIWRRGSSALSPDFRDASSAEKLLCPNEMNRKGHGVMQGKDGRYYSWFGIGHALTMLPFHIAGKGLATILPSVDPWMLEQQIKTKGELSGRAYGEEFLAHFVVSFHSPLFAALSCLILFRLLGYFSVTARTRIVTILLIALTTQFGPQSRESMSDTTAAFFLFFSLERALAWRFAAARPTALILCGALGGMAVLTRVFHLLPLGSLALYLAFHCLGAQSETRQWKNLACFAIGAMPFGIFLLCFNYSRFGSPFENGYSAGTADGYWNFPFWIGFLFLALSPGKGAFLFSPLLFVIPLAIRRVWRRSPSELLLFSAYFFLPWILASFTTGWHSSQAWACRYMTAGSVLMLAILLPELLVWAKSSSRVLKSVLLVLACLGFLVNLGGFLSPYRGYYSLLTRNDVVAELWPAAHDLGGDAFQNLCAAPRLSPTIGHWIYASLSLSEKIPNGPGTEVFAALTGKALDLPARPAFAEDFAFRHLWPIGLAWRTGSSWPYVLGSLLAAFIGLVALGLRRALLVHEKQRDAKPPSVASG